MTTVNVLAAASPMCSACSDCAAQHGAIEATGTVSSQQIYGALARRAEQRPEQSAE